MEGKTKSGFNYKVDENMAKDYRYLRSLAKLQKGDDADKFIALDTIGTMLLGDGIDNLIQHVEKLNDGYAPIDKVVVEIDEIVRACTPKNSPSSQE